MARHRTDVESVITDFETIRKQAEREPEDTEELIKIQEYIKQVKETTLKQLDIELEGMLERFMYLLDVHLFSDSDQGSKSCNWINYARWLRLTLLHVEWL